MPTPAITRVREAGPALPACREGGDSGRFAKGDAPQIIRFGKSVLLFELCPLSGPSSPGGTVDLPGTFPNGVVDAFFGQELGSQVAYNGFKTVEQV